MIWISACFDSARQLLDAYGQTAPELVILDIDMPGINGMEAAHKIRAFDEKVALLFVTNMKHYALEGYFCGGAGLFDQAGLL